MSKKKKPKYSMSKEQRILMLEIALEDAKKSTFPKAKFKEALKKLGIKYYLGTGGVVTPFPDLEKTMNKVIKEIDKFKKARSKLIKENKDKEYIDSVDVTSFDNAIKYLSENKKQNKG